MLKALKPLGKGSNTVLMGGKKVKGRKRQIVVDSMGNLHHVLVHKANIHDSKGGAVLADMVLKQQTHVKNMSADLG